MTQEKKHKTIASLVTLLSMCVIFLILFFCGMSHQVPPPNPKKVILIELGEVGGGGGGGNERPESGAVSRPSSAPNIATQSSEETPVVANNPTPTHNQEQSTAEVKPKPDARAAYRPGRGGGSGGGSGTGIGSGTGSGLGPGEGSGSGGGIGYGTGNRRYLYTPKLTINENGVVYVEVHVSATGAVINARVISNSKYPTTITNSNILADCVNRAKTVKYAAGKEELRIITFVP